MTTPASAQTKTPGGVVGGGGGGGGGAPSGGGGGGGIKAGGVIGGGGGGGGGFSGGMVAGPRVGMAPQTSWTARPGWTGNWNSGWRPHHHRRFIGPGIGFGTGFALGAYAAQPYYYDEPYYYDAPYDDGYIIGNSVASPDDIAYCQRRYRSYDVNSGTFLGRDGRRHPCPAG
jgi:hypothetical protein